MVATWCQSPNATATLHGFHAACVVGAVGMLVTGAKPCTPTLYTTAVVALLAVANVADVYWWPVLVTLFGVTSRVPPQRRGHR